MKPSASTRGFSLLEVMIALAILSVGLVFLFQVQARSIQLASQAREITLATMLARAKLLDCQTDLLKKGFSIGDYNESGSFSDDDHPDIYWECHAYEPEMPAADGGDVSSAFGGGAAGAGGGDDANNDPGMAFLGPILSQMSSVLGKSIRELVVIVRWGSGDDIEEMTVTTHVVDKQPIVGIAQMLQQQCRAPAAPTAGGGGAGGGAAGTPPVTPPPARGGK
jgi:general secretion pathway protein I